MFVNLNNVSDLHNWENYGILITEKETIINEETFDQKYYNCSGVVKRKLVE